MTETMSNEINSYDKDPLKLGLEEIGERIRLATVGHHDTDFSNAFTRNFEISGNHKLMLAYSEVGFRKDSQGPEVFIQSQEIIDGILASKVLRWPELYPTDLRLTSVGKARRVAPINPRSAKQDISDAQRLVSLANECLTDIEKADG